MHVMHVSSFSSSSRPRVCEPGLEGCLGRGAIRLRAETCRPRIFLATNSLRYSVDVREGYRYVQSSCMCLFGVTSYTVVLFHHRHRRACAHQNSYGVWVFALAVHRLELGSPRRYNVVVSCTESIGMPWCENNDCFCDCHASGLLKRALSSLIIAKSHKNPDERTCSAVRAAPISTAAWISRAPSSRVCHGGRKVCAVGSALLRPLSQSGA